MRDKQVATFLETWDGFMIGTVISSGHPTVQSSLSDILEANPLPKYFLSPKACEGILRRAEKRGKKLPVMLETALRAQAEI